MKGWIAENNKNNLIEEVRQKKFTDDLCKEEIACINRAKEILKIRRKK